jgi:hypothetical protein
LRKRYHRPSRLRRSCCSPPTVTRLARTLMLRWGDPGRCEAVPGVGHLRRRRRPRRLVEDAEPGGTGQAPRRSLQLEHGVGEADAGSQVPSLGGGGRQRPPARSAAVSSSRPEVPEPVRTSHARRAASAARRRSPRPSKGASRAGRSATAQVGPPRPSRWWRRRQRDPGTRAQARGRGRRLEHRRGVATRLVVDAVAALRARTGRRAPRPCPMPRSWRSTKGSSSSASAMR